MKNAGLFVVGFLSVSFCLHESAGCQTSLAPPLSLAAPPLPDKGSPPATTDNIWPPMAAPDVAPPRATTKSSPPSATTNVWPPMAIDDVPPPTATAKRSASPVTAKKPSPPVIAKDTLPTAAATDAPPTATPKRSAPLVSAKDTPPPAITEDAQPTATARDTSSAAIGVAPVIARMPPSPQPAADHDGFSIGIIDEGDTAGQTTRPVRPRPAKKSEFRQEPDSVEAQLLVDQAEDEKLRRKLTICRGCK
jgi:hypothetical protein